MVIYSLKRNIFPHFQLQMLSLLQLQSHPPQLFMLPGNLQQSNNTMHNVSPTHLPSHIQNTFCWSLLCCLCATYVHSLHFKPIHVFSDLCPSSRKYQWEQWCEYMCFSKLNHTPNIMLYKKDKCICFFQSTDFSPWIKMLFDLWSQLRQIQNSLY